MMAAAYQLLTLFTATTVSEPAKADYGLLRRSSLSRHLTAENSKDSPLQKKRQAFKISSCWKTIATWTASAPRANRGLRQQEHEAKVIEELVVVIKHKLRSLKQTEGKISVSAYDTAWVARIPDAHISGKPQFPGWLEWIVANQHSDGSWGDQLKHWLYDRFIQTLACVVALKSWNYCASCVRRGEGYIQRYADKLEDQEILHMPIGFELSFPALLFEAKSLGLDLPYETPFFAVLQKLREKKLQRVPLELLHEQPTTLLHTLEGIQSLNIDWNRVLKFQSVDCSMCCSPSSTVVLYMHTGDEKCLSYLKNVVQRFHHAIPTCYPLDTFHNLWVVDTLERLGISHHFKAEIEEVLASVYRQWSDEQGLCWARVLKDLPDLDHTSMGFLLLRQHGYSVSAEAFKGFHKEQGFVCFAVGQMVQGVSDMYNLFRAAQTAYPEEERLVEANAFDREFLMDALTKNKGGADKWSLKKDLSGEVEYTLKYPDHKSLKHMEIRHYLDKYGPEDAWIGKSIYRLPLVNNHDYLTLAKADFNLCQKLHQKELRQILRWMSNSGLPSSWSFRQKIVMLYALFSAEVWEAEFAPLRIAVGQCMFIATAMYQLVQLSSLTDVLHFVDAIRRWDPSRVPYELPPKFSSCFLLLFNTLNASAEHLSENTGLIQQLVQILNKFGREPTRAEEEYTKKYSPTELKKKVTAELAGRVYLSPDEVFEHQQAPLDQEPATTEPAIEPAPETATRPAVEHVTEVNEERAPSVDLGGSDELVEELSSEAAEETASAQCQIVEPRVTYNAGQVSARSKTKASKKRPSRR